MYYLYILRSLKDKNLYVGCTSSLEERLRRHKSGHVRATQSRRPFELVYFEEYSDKGEAFNRERFLKSLYGYKTKKKLINSFKYKRLL